MNIRYISIAGPLFFFACTGTDYEGTGDRERDATDAGTSTPTPAVTGTPNPDAVNDGGNDAGNNPCTFDPSRIDVPGNGLDEDCSGQADDDSPVCDAALTLASSDAFDAAKAIGLCKKASAGGNAWGVIDARYVLPDGTAIGAASATSWGLLTAFGSNTPRAGQAFVALSSGTARAANQPGYVAPRNGLDKGYANALPSGFPRAMPSCGGTTIGDGHDGIALEVRVRVPSNAKALSFAHQFFSADYSDTICSSANDPFVVLMDPKPAGSPDGNVVLDANGGALTTNATTLIRACTPGTHNGLTFTCPLSTAPLTGTGFEGRASTGWLKTTVPVTGGTEITLRFAIWDSSDGLSDSTALVDGFAFSTEPAAAINTVAQ